MRKPRLLIFASGSRDSGGSGFENLVRSSLAGELEPEISAVVSNQATGGVQRRAERLRVRFIHFSAPWTADRYREIARETDSDFFALSGWLKHVSGLDPRRTFNIHPGPLPRTGGPGMYGSSVHGMVLQAFRQGQLLRSEVTMHFVGEQYDCGAPVFFRVPVEIRPEDTVESLAARVQIVEHCWQPKITNLVVQGRISWDGSRLDSLICPAECLSSCPAS